MKPPPRQLDFGTLSRGINRDVSEPVRHFSASDAFLKWPRCRVENTLKTYKTKTSGGDSGVGFGFDEVPLILRCVS